MKGFLLIIQFIILIFIGSLLSQLFMFAIEKESRYQEERLTCQEILYHSTDQSLIDICKGEMR